MEENVKLTIWEQKILFRNFRTFIIEDDSINLFIST